MIQLLPYVNMLNVTALKIKLEIFKEPPFTPFRPTGGP